MDFNFYLYVSMYICFNCFVKTKHQIQKEVCITIYERILKEHKRLQEQIKDLEAKIATLPKGKLICCHNKKYYKWFSSNGHEKTYIPKANRALAEQLATKKYLTLTLEDLKNEVRALDFYLKHHNKDAGQAEKLLTEEFGFSELLSSHFTPLSQELSSWKESPYEQNPYYTDQLIHRTAAGIHVRSKSEAMIALLLYKNKIPFRYECALRRNETTVYPDFTIRHPKTGEFYYWEHFGLMDDPVYSKNAYSKLQFYTSCNIIPSIQLITTFETKDIPLSSEMIESLIEYYFL